MKNLVYFMLVVAVFVQTTSSFYIPGVAPREYEDSELVEIKV